MPWIPRPCLAGEHMCTSLHKASKMSRKIPPSISSWFWRNKAGDVSRKATVFTAHQALHLWGFVLPIGNDDTHSFHCAGPGCFPEHFPSIFLFDHTMKTRDSYLGSSQLGTRLGTTSLPTVVIFPPQERESITSLEGSFPSWLRR